jgi:ABC-type uncharacterized transport system involved in gliding motility auxiliary subunit
LNVLTAALALLAVAVMVNYLASRHYVRWHAAGDPRYQLSPLTRQLLRTLTNDVRVIVFFEPDPQNTLCSLVKGLLTEYQLACPRLRLEYVDYGVDPGRAARIKDQFHLAARASDDLVIFESQGRHKVVYENELADYDLSGALRGEPVRRSVFRGEPLFTSAIISVAEARPVRAYALEGHGEHDLNSEDATSGYAEFYRLLREKNVAVTPLTLGTNLVPADCQLLLVAGPRYAIPPAELEGIRAYLRGGGRALMLLTNPLRPNTRASGLETLLTEWQVRVGDDVVVDRAQSKSTAAEVLLAGNFGDHPIVRPLQRARLGLVTPRSVRRRAGAPKVEGLKVDELMFTSGEGAALANTRGSLTSETNGVVPLAVAVDKGTLAGVSPDRGSTRIVVVGESLFLANTLIGWEANRDFASLAVNWLVDRSHLLQVGPRPIHEYRVSLSPAQLHAVHWILLAVLPGSVMLVGILVWMRRRT